MLPGVRTLERVKKERDQPAVDANRLPGNRLFSDLEEKKLYQYVVDKQRKGAHFSKRMLKTAAHTLATRLRPGRKPTQSSNQWRARSLNVVVMSRPSKASLQHPEDSPSACDCVRNTVVRTGLTDCYNRTTDLRELVSNGMDFVSATCRIAALLGSVASCGACAAK
jgi:hypothetical protein